MEKREKVKQKLTNKQKVIGIVAILVILITIVAIIIGTRNYKQKSKTQLANNELNTVLEIPSITDENTVFNISTLEETENVTIKVDKKLEDYNIYYLVEKIIEVEIDDTVGDSTAEIIDKNDFSTYSLYENEINLTQNSNIYFVYEKDGSYSLNIYELKITNIIKALQTEDENIEDKQVDKDAKANKTSPYYIKVNYGANTVTIYG